jgi:hypothetical protein
MKFDNVNQLYCKVQGRFNLSISPSYDVLLELLMKAGDEIQLPANGGSNAEGFGNIEEESFNTDDFSSSTSTELKTTSTSPSDELKTSSGSTTSSNQNDNHETEIASDDRKPPSNEPELSVFNVTETTDLNDDRETTSDDRKPASMPNNNQGQVQKEESISCTDHLMHESLNKVIQLNQNHESFPYTLWRMLNNETGAGHQCIKWLADGDGFEVTNQNVLEKDILTKYFGPCLFQSFVRKLYR